ncbi:MjaI family restriction endonuclease [Raineya orbicola]|jgi:Mor family transcriptional regulator|uniref:MjaI restriction endonuclease n=1 Tax=Raineya orbicola TaxID=2016530 RepID=A0A2N3ICP5_9BACT|nr:MjaI family restriction endonuclease [Raineya orbicola]PKQ68059.1 MjaI restriction endonuclease [Raineya orbicola]
MPKEWILNSAVNRFQLNFKKNVGAVSEAIRKCSPKNIEEWRNYYFQNVRSKEHIEELGKRLYVKVTEVIQAEVSEITLEDCINYMLQLVIDRTYDGYVTEIQTIYGQLQAELGIKIEPAPDEWDRLFNVDFYIKIAEKYIGLQIKPINKGIQLPEMFKEYALQEKSHQEFTKKFGGKVFYLFSTSVEGKKEIQNKEVIEEIRAEIERLKQL